MFEVNAGAQQLLKRLNSDKKRIEGHRITHFPRFGQGLSRAFRVKEDIGKVIGKLGRTAQAMRIILGAAASKINKRSALEIVE